MADLYSISDGQILQLIGATIRRTRLAQNITQANLADDADVPISTLRRIESGEIGTIGSLLRVMRVLGILDSIKSLTEEEKMSPNEYLQLMSSATKKKRQRAHKSKPKTIQEESEW